MWGINFIYLFLYNFIIYTIDDLRGYGILVAFQIHQGDNQEDKS